jgi:ABC-type nitrate/sulfonate/bicarbonate transport system substrate-binding protein
MMAMARRNRRFLVVALAAIAAVLTAAGASAEDKIRIGQATPTLSFLPVMAARALDTFKAEGLALEWASINGGDPRALAALDAGDIDLAAVGSESALQAIAKGQPYVFVYSLMSKMSLDLTVSNAFLEKHAVSPSDPLAKRLAALKGATIGVSAIGGTQDRAARWLAGKAGLDPKRDINAALIGAPPAIQAALDNKRIDGFVLSPPEGLIAEDNGTGKVLIRLGNEFPELRQFYYLVLVAKTPIDEAKKKLITRTVRVLQATSAGLLADPDGSADRIQKALYGKIKPAIIRAALKDLSGGIVDGGRFAADGMAQFLKLTSGFGVELDRPLGQGDPFWTNEFVDAARRR